MAKQVAKVPDSMLPGMVDDRARRDLLDSFFVSVEGRLVYASRLPSKDERTQLQTWNADLVRAMRPASMSVAELDEARRNLSALFLGYGSMRYEADGIVEIVNAYLLVLQKYPLFAIVKAIDDVAANRVPGLNPDRPPTSPRMGKIAADHVSALAAQQIKIDNILKAKLLLRSDKTMESRARVAASLQDFHGKLVGGGAEGLLEPDERRSEAERQRKTNDAVILREYEHYGIAPRYSGGVLVSLSLARTMGMLDQDDLSAFR